MSPVNPVTTATTGVGKRALAAMGPALLELGGDLLPGFVDALAAELESTDYLLTPTILARVPQPGTPLSDAARTPYPAWLAQVAGQTIPASTPTEVARQQLLARRVDRRGTTTAMIEAVKATLTGERRVALTERYGGDPWVVRVVTYTAETPDPAATQAAALSEKPVGLVLDYRTAAGQSYAATTAEGKTYAQHTATGRTYQTRSMVLSG